ncbi:MAG: Na+/H+ antiporter subunit E, partial [Betaproteobacteria bacterium]|nr:Na+/H+ antiporter subunit E [Betaproteobacteria bacterium]
MLLYAILFVLFYAFWLLMSGIYDSAFLLAAGAGSSLAVVWFAHRMAVADREGHPVHLVWAALVYVPWLVREILKSA